VECILVAFTEIKHPNSLYHTAWFTMETDGLVTCFESLFRHRSQEEIDEVRSVNVAELRDPQKDEVRVQEDKWLVLLGICTHLGTLSLWCDR